MMCRLILAVLGVLTCGAAMLLGTAAASADGWPQTPDNPPWVAVEGRRFMDSAGRQLILHGANTGGYNKSDPGWIDAESYARMKSWGFNVVRLQLDWSELEPQCGKYNEAYLRRVDQQVAFARTAGVYVFLDMHQDLFSVKVCDGAPAWATLDEGLPHVETPDFWPAAYCVSPMVQKAFDNFYANKPGPDGVGVQDRFAMAWRCVAKRYAGESIVIGYDLLNEPFPGSAMKALPMLVAARMAKVLADRGESLDLAALMKDLQTAEGRQRAVARLNDPALIREFLDAMEPTFETFERESLDPLYRRAAKAIREVDARHLLLIESGGAANSGVRSHISPITDASGKRDPLQALVPHAYGLPFGDPSPHHIVEIMARIADLSRRLDMPVLLGEWDAYLGDGRDRQRREIALLIVAELEKHLFGDTFWLLKPDLGQRLFFDAIRRPYPASVAGELRGYHWDQAAGTFRCLWKESGAAKLPSRIYVPKSHFPKGFDVELAPPGKYRREELGSDRSASVLAIDPLDRPAARELVVRPASH